MLALMAGRNAGAGVTLVKEGKVSPILPTTPFLPHLAQVLTRACTNSVAQLQLCPILLHRAPTEHKSSRSNAHSRFPRFRTHSPSNTKTSHLLRTHALHIHIQTQLAAKHSARGVPRRAAQPALRPARRTGPTRARERRALCARAWRAGHATRRQRRFFAQDEEACRAGERGTWHAR
jgi:hypothetical protein